MAYLRHIKQNSVDSHQTSPAYMLTFVRFKNRDTHNFPQNNALDINVPIVIISDAIQVSVNSSKASHIHQASMLLMGGDINYSTAIAPGDFVLINLVNGDDKLFGTGNTLETRGSNSLYDRALRGRAINQADDGFKGLFKIQSVRRLLSVSPDGPKTFHYQITAAAFTEFNQVVYFNPYLYLPTELSSISIALNTNASQEWANNLNKDLNNLSRIFKSFIGFLIGTGFGNSFNSSPNDTVVRNNNQSFSLPSGVTSLMGIKSNMAGTKAADLFNYYVGIEKYEQSDYSKTNSTRQKTWSTDDSIGLNPTMGTKAGMFYSTGPELSGVALIQAEPWCQVTAWSILNQYSNSLMNEMYTAYKLTPDNVVMPVVVFRQKPFTSNKFKSSNKNIQNTAFLDLPRWVISPDLITSLSLGRDEVARINFVHIIGKTRFLDQKDALAQQAASRLQKQDDEDIKRSGLKPFISACDFDFPADQSKLTKAPEWNALMFDWLNNGHLKENGTLICAGLEENIAVGDNVQINDTVLHIESINHIMTVEADGKKSFRTTLQLSYGVDTGESSDKIYPEMSQTNTENYRSDDYNNKGAMLPGYSDSQDVKDRKNGEKTTPLKEEYIDSGEVFFTATPKKPKA